MLVFLVEIWKISKIHRLKGKGVFFIIYSYRWWFRTPADQVEVGRLSHYLQGLGYIPGGCLGFLPSTVVGTFHWNKRSNSWSLGIIADGSWAAKLISIAYPLIFHHAWIYWRCIKPPFGRLFFWLFSSILSKSNYGFPLIRPNQARISGDSTLGKGGLKIAMRVETSQIRRFQSFFCWMPGWPFFFSRIPVTPRGWHDTFWTNS